MLYSSGCFCVCTRETSLYSFFRNLYLHKCYFKPCCLAVHTIPLTFINRTVQKIRGNLKLYLFLLFFVVHFILLLSTHSLCSDWKHPMYSCTQDCVRLCFRVCLEISRLYSSVPHCTVCPYRICMVLCYVN